MKPLKNLPINILLCFSVQQLVVKGLEQDWFTVKTSMANHNQGIPAAILKSLLPRKTVMISLVGSGDQETGER